MRPRGLLRSLSAVFVFVSCEPGLRGARAQEPTILRPTTHGTSSALDNPHHAYDLSVTSAAGKSLTRVCNKQCKGISRVSTTWSGFARGYRPQQLKVKWQTGAAVIMFGSDKAAVRARIDYSRDAGRTWTVVERFASSATTACTGQPLSCPDHWAPAVSLTPTQRSELLRVRATLEVDLQQCQDCAFGASNVNGGISVYDIQLVATPAPVRRGKR